MGSGSHGRGDGAVVGEGSGATQAGAAAALDGERYNRQLHQDEKIRIKKLANGDADKEARLTAAACALTKCYAEYPVGSKSYQDLKQLAEMGASDAVANERDLLAQQRGMFGYSTTGVFSDANIDAAKQFNNTYQVTTRVVGGGQALLGGLGVAGSVATAPVSCATGVGCVANAVVTTVSADAMQAGAKQVISGNPEPTYLNNGLEGLGMSPEAAQIVEMAVGGGAAITAGAVANKVIDQSIAISKLSAASYGDFLTNGLKATPAIMQTPQAQALIREIQAGNPTLQQSTVERFAREYIESGLGLPQSGIAAQGTTLIKVIPRGDGVSPYSGYWMSPQQAQAMATMMPDQAARALGLPAAQAANILKNGMDFLAIKPKAGLTPNIFVSEVAGTNQGTLVFPGGAQQVLVPNRTQWTTPTQVNPFTLK